MKALAALLAVAAIAGCAAPSHDHAAFTDVATSVSNDAFGSPATQPAEPAYWLKQLPVRFVTDASLDRLWDAAERVSQDYLFPIDRRDRREGLLTTVPTVSPQWFEPWRRELQTISDVADSSVATIRRSIRWDFARNGEGYYVVPKVLIERQSLTEERISGVLSRAYFRRGVTDTTFGTRETDRNLLLPDSYWYPVGRDFAFEQRLVDKMRVHLAAVASR